MLAMVRALMPNPAVLLIDEPSAGLAPRLIDRTFDHIERIRQTGTAVLIVEQNVKAGLRIADHGYVLDMGTNRFEGTASELRESEKIRDAHLGV